MYYPKKELQASLQVGAAQASLDLNDFQRQAGASKRHVYLIFLGGASPMPQEEQAQTGVPGLGICDQSR